MSLVRRIAPLLALVLMMILGGCDGASPGNGGGTVAAGGSAGGGSGPSPLPPPGFVVSLAVTPPRALLSHGATQQLQVVATYADATRHNVTRLVTWNAAQPQVASVSRTGLLTAGLAGATTVTASYKGASGSMTLQVVNGTLQGISIAPTAASVIAGGSQQFRAIAALSEGQTVDVTNLAQWTSSDAAVATVSNGSQTAGLAQGRATGAVSVTAAYGAFTASARLQVTALKVVSVKVSPSTATLHVGNSEGFHATATYSDDSQDDVTAQAAWSTSNAAVCTVTAGTATAVGAGSASVTATFQGQRGQGTVTVAAAQLLSISVTPANATLAFGSDRQYQAIGTYDDGDTDDLTAKVTWTSSKPGVATVTAGGLVAAVTAGASNISATLGAITGTTGVTVSAPPLVSLTITPATNTSLITGTTRAYTATGRFADGTTGDVTRTVTWSSSDPRVASVSAQGVVSANRNGLADITASEGTITASVRARVMLYAYATDGEAVYGYSVDPASGGLTPVPGPTFPFQSCLCAVAIDPANRFLYALDGGMNQVYTFDIHDSDGSLLLRVGNVATGDFPNSIQITPDGRFLYVTNGNDGTVSGFALGGNGALTPIAGEPFKVGTNPTQVAFDPTSRFAYVTDAGDNSVTAMSIDPQTGALAQLAEYPSGTDAFGIVVMPSGRFLYTVSPTDGAIYGFGLNPDGRLTALAGSPWMFGCAPFSLVADPLGRFIYNQDFSTDAINGWAVDPTTGALTPTPGQPYGNGGILPGILALDPAGRFLYAAYLIDPVLAGYGIDATTGRLAPLSSSPVPVANPMEYVQLTH